VPTILVNNAGIFGPIALVKVIFTGFGVPELRDFMTQYFDGEPHVNFVVRTATQRSGPKHS
jgi:hypothetical protein